MMSGKLAIAFLLGAYIVTWQAKRAFGAGIMTPHDQTPNPFHVVGRGLARNPLWSFVP